MEMEEGFLGEGKRRNLVIKISVNEEESFFIKSKFNQYKSAISPRRKSMSEF